jgi:class 3 adenylate cyclase/tetratricopeptide (TPR) repeat protein
MQSVAGERRNVAVLVADVADSTTIGEQLGPERSKFLFDEVVRLMSEQIQRYEGTVAQLTGDGVLALFGAPTAHEDDSERAVRAAVGIHDTLAAYAQEVAEAYGIDLTARVAVNTGPVVLAAGELPDEERYNALGDTVNVAARLQALAGERGTAVGPATARQVKRTFELASLGEIELKGKDERVDAYRVIAELRAAESAPRTPLVGRDRELETLVDALDALVDGRGAIVSITGEAGIGKTRLIAEARERAGGEMRVLAGHAVSYGRAIPYWPVRGLLRDWLGLGESEHPARVQIELKAALAHTCGDAAAGQYPFVATLLGLELEPDLASKLAHLGDESVQNLTVDGLRGLVRALAREQPSCLVLEDLHWADDATLDLVDALFALPEEEALALLLVYRSERDHRSWELGQRARQRYPHRYVELELAPLDTEAARAIAGDAIPDDVARLLVDRAGGNPFFLEEAVRDLQERGAVGADAAQLAVPALVQEALQARLNRLAPQTREIVAVASVVGRMFGLPLLERLAPREELVPALSELQRLALVVEERRRPAPEYRFRHGLVQDVAYASLLEPKRRELHRRVGEALEEIYRDAPTEAYGLLAHHFAEADEPAKAVEYLVKAGDAARGLNANEEAARHYERAIDAVQRLEGTEEGERIELEIALGEVRLRAGEVAEARRRFTAAAEAARSLGRPDLLARAALGFAGLVVVVRDVDAEAVELLEEALAALDGRDDALRARVLARLAIELYYSAPDGRESLSEEAVAAALRARDPDAQLDALNARHVSLWRPDRLAERLKVATEMMELSQRSDDRDGELQARNWRVADLWELADMEAVDAEVAEHDRLANELMLPGFLWYTPLWRAAQAILAGRFDAGQALLDEALRLGRAAGDRNADLLVDVARYGIHAARGTPSEEDFARFEQRAEGSLSGMAFRCALSWWYADLGREADARRHFQIAVRYGVGSFPLDVNFLAAMPELSEASVLLGETEVSGEVYARLSPFAGRHVAVSGRGLLSFGAVDYFLAHAAEALGRAENARRHYEDALTFEERIGARAWLARSRARYAAFLLAAGGPDDRRRAEDLHDAAAEAADELALAGVSRTLAAMGEAA